MSNSDSTGTHEIVLEEHAASVRMGYGHDPYDTYPTVRHPTSSGRNADLRRLSEWIRTKKQVEQLKRADAQASDSGQALDVPQLHRTR